MIELHVRVETVINQYAVQQLAGQLASWEGTQRMDPKQMMGKKADRFAALNNKGDAKVLVGVEEKLSGPSGTYSSVTVRVEISARCDQNEKSVSETHELLFTEGLKALEFYMTPALNMLINHTEKQSR
jgi:hypothetical protein